MLISFAKGFVTAFVEGQNLYNLITLDNVKDLVLDYIAFGVIAEFDELAIGIYKRRSEFQLLTLDIKFDKFRKTKVDPPLTIESRENK